MKCLLTKCRGEMVLHETKNDAYIECFKCSRVLRMMNKEDTVKYFRENKEG